MRRAALILAAALLSATLYSCAGHQQSMVDAAGPQSGSVERLWWVFFWLLLAIFVAVMITLFLALSRGRTQEEREAIEREHAAPPAVENRAGRIVGGAVIATVATLLALIAVSVATGKQNATLGETADKLTIEVTGLQWWWYIRYLNDDASRIVVTANEIHIPVGRVVQIRGTSLDVIHSFWVPNLNGKVDLIPSRVTTQTIRADRPGRFRGQCAEFCGLQHAHMVLWVVAEPQAQFEQWVDRQLKPAAPPADADTQRGEQVFLSRGCVLCHAIAGTPAQGNNGPDLTHFGSRLTIAAGTLPNTKGNLGGWIGDPQTIKPGNHMATIPLGSDEVQPLLDFLESLQ